MHQAQPPEPPSRGTDLRELRDQQTTVITDDDVLDLPGTMNKKTDLPVQFMGEFAQRPGHFGTDDQMPLHPAADSRSRSLQLILFQSINISTQPG